MPPGRHLPVHRSQSRSPASGSRCRTPRSTTADCGRPRGATGGLLRRLFERSASGEGTVFVDLDDTPLPTPPDDLVPLEVPAGTLVVLHGLLPHWSDANRSDRSRHAYSLHVIDAKAAYPATNWLQRGPDMPLRGF